MIAIHKSNQPSNIFFSTFTFSFHFLRFQPCQLSQTLHPTAMLSTTDISFLLINKLKKEWATEEEKVEEAIKKNRRELCEDARDA